MPTIVRSCGGGGGADISALTNAATVNQVLEGCQFYGAGSEDPQTGTIKNNGAVAKTAPYSGSGYYSSITISTTGNAEASHVLSGKTFMNGSGTQTGTMINKGNINTSIEVGGKYNGTAGYYSNITVAGPTLNGNAAAADVLTGKSFYSNTGTIINGSMENYGTLIGSVGVGGTYKNTNAGYYSSIAINGPTLNGNASASNVLSGKTFYNTSGTLRTGSMTNHGSVSKTISPGGSWTGSAGYYSGITISASKASTSGNADNSKVLYGYTYMNSSGAQTGTLRLYRYAGDITTSWKEISLGWTPSYYGATTSPGYGRNARTKCYLVGTTLYVCHNGSDTWNGRIIAST